MIEIISFDELQKGDIILIEGLDEDEVRVVTVKSKTNDGLIMPIEMHGIDYTPEDPEQIVRIGNKKQSPILSVMVDHINLTLSKSIYNRLEKVIKNTI